MIIRTYLDKCTTIVKGSKLNSGINPIAELHYGKNSVYSRILLHFDHNKIKSMVEDKTFADVSKLHHYLHIFNSGGLDFTDLHSMKQSEITNLEASRASSFDLIFFLIPQEWDNGKGYDMTLGKYYFNNGSSHLTKLVSEDGCNWFKPRNGYVWEEEGVYSTSTLSKEYDKFGTEEGSAIIIARQHFDLGDENIHIDVTDVVNKYITGDLENYGLGIAFTPLTELTEENMERFCAFFSPRTHTFFEPFIETVYDDTIHDDRGNFTINKVNRLYLYTNIDGIPQNLDEMPMCSINDTPYEVKQYSKGIYYVEVFGDKALYMQKRMYYDLWYNLKYNGVEFDSIEMDFIVYGTERSFNFGNGLNTTEHCDPVLSGIRNNERIYRNDDMRRVDVICRKAYERNKVIHPSSMRYRLYVMDGTRELTLCEESVNCGINEEWFNIDVQSLIPNTYYIDITVDYPQETRTYKKCLDFVIVNDANNKF